MFEACIFDLDGVIVDTAKYHFIAWRRLANELGFDFTEVENEQLKGVSRVESLDLILKWGGIQLGEAEKERLAEKKNNWYREFILKMEADEILEGVIPFLDELERRGVKLVLGSSSKNAATIIERVGLSDRFAAIIDGTKTTRTKPDPQVFELGAAAVGAQPAQCIVFEDAEKGIEAALNGGFYTVGVGSAEVLGDAHFVIPGFQGVTVDEVFEAVLM
ncbi:MAG TPA: beta-phosphoglucomutase [Saprospiraceae bacterium]|nr:beta-phosphoglucomutase [Saprospiraceae bacterium]HMQ85077.1 beta-phosphoglucomutase [Saprospiraceae bacterium]